MAKSRSTKGGSPSKGTKFSPPKPKGTSTYRNERSRAPSYIDPSGVTPMSKKKGGTRLGHHADSDME